MKGNIKGIVAAAIALVATGGIFYWQQQHGGSTSSATTAATPVVVDPAKYKDGTYSADGTYGTPGGQESVHVSVTLAGGIITDSQFSGSGVSDVSKNFMNRFASGYKTVVVGKYIDAVQLKAVSGSSLTPKGFMAALASIKAQAKS